MDNGKVRDKNLKPLTDNLGYKTVWERMKMEHGQKKLVVNAHADKIINLTPVWGSSNEEPQEFYERLKRCYDALYTLSELDKLDRFLICILNKFPHLN